MSEKYYLGLDMGTGSVGWAVTNPNYEIIRKHGKSLWGSRLFDTAETAEDRRMHRTARRRRDREKYRINVLQEIFSEEINKVDPGFFLRMKESRYVPEDKRDSNGNCPDFPYALFVDSDYNDKDYHKEFPTIYHLRKMLMETDEMPDIRLVYLAIHHMMKHRGHFLLSGDINSVRDFRNVFTSLNQCLIDEELDYNIGDKNEIINDAEAILSDKNCTKSDKKKKLIKLFEAKTKCEKAVLTLISGGKISLADIFGDTSLNESERPKISFSDSNYDDYVLEVESELAERFYIIEQAKAVYDWSVLADILGKHESLSEAKVEVYEKHKTDLRLLKDLAKEYLTEEDYKEMFVVTDGKISNYPAYIGMTKYNGRKVDLDGKLCVRDDFYKYIKNKFKIGKTDCLIKDIAVLENITSDMENGLFMPKQVNGDNGVIPYQVHLFELKHILENLECKSDCIKDNKDKIIQLFTFRIPYYVGPLNVVRDENDSKFTWAKRNSNEKIYPWNFEEVIDVEESAERFIKRMTNKCTYLYGEDVLPKDSLLYSKFMVLNELNNVRLNGDKLTVELKQAIYNDLFKRKRKVTQKALKNYLEKEGICKKNEAEITGIDGDFKGSLKAYHDFKQKLSGIELSDAEKETIIVNIVLFGDDKKLLKSRIGKLFPQLTDGQKKALCSLTYTGWGRLSKEFLENITAPAPGTGEVWSIINALWETNDNLMQLLSKEYLFMEQVEEHNKGKKKSELTYETVNKLYVSPAVKRQIWQTIKVVKEIKKIMGGDPERVFIEVAREKQDNNRTVSRKNKLIDLYKKCKEEEKDWISELNSYDENRLRSDKLYLYYTQKGRCMYTGEIINLEELWDNTKYDIDHIYPQSKVMDDSLNNRVLVKKNINAAKSDTYPLDQSIRSHMITFWKSLLDKGFIEKEKYERLTRTTPFSDNELAGFIARQLVETRQGTKAVAEILQEVFPEADIVYSKAKVVSEFRHKFDLFKVREMNDLHHAKDAYLNVVVGNTYFVKFTKDAAWFIRNNPGRSYSLNNMFTSKYDAERNGEIAWKSDKNGGKGTIETVRKVMDKNDILVSRRTHIVKGELFNQQLLKKGNGQVPIKGSDSRLHNINNYGGYNSATGAYFMLAESDDKKGNLIRTIEDVPIYLKDRIEQSDEERIKYLEEYKGLKNPQVLIKCIKKDTLFKINGFPLYLAGRAGKKLIFKNACQLVLNKDSQLVLKDIIKFNKRLMQNKDLKITDYDGINFDNTEKLYDVFALKLSDSLYSKRPNNQKETICNNKDKFLALKLEDRCVVLMEILHLFQSVSMASNLTMISGTGRSGIIQLSNNITKIENISIECCSVTSVFNKKIDISTL